MKIMAMTVMMIPINSREWMADTPSAKGGRKKTTYLPMGDNNTNRVSSIFKPREDIAACLMMTKTIIC